ncbi:Pycsar system effector family protein [Kitasatospora sp. NPDC059646]|uniref:Pycsar system effector family protein n=1 Tax=Kitasatospora sp. NPDC059646 TaxID=3346893 RepID=UPI0036A512E2
MEAALGVRSAAVMVDLQRADGKAAALCALASGTLAAVVAAAPVWSTGELVTAAMLVGCVLLLASAVAALLAIRPVLPRGRLSAELEPFEPDAVRGSGLTAPTVLDEVTLLALEVQRLRRLAVLVEQKYRVIKVAVDLVASAGTVTGIGLLMSCAA